MHLVSTSLAVVVVLLRNATADAVAPGSNAVATQRLLVTESGEPVPTAVGALRTTVTGGASAIAARAVALRGTAGAVLTARRNAQSVIRVSVFQISERSDHDRCDCPSRGSGRPRQESPAVHAPARSSDECLNARVALGHGCCPLLRSPSADTVAAEATPRW